MFGHTDRTDPVTENGRRGPGIGCSLRARRRELKNPQSEIAKELAKQRQKARVVPERLQGSGSKKRQRGDKKASQTPPNSPACESGKTEPVCSV